MAAGFIGGINSKLLFVVSVTVPVSSFSGVFYQRLSLVFLVKTNNHSLIHSKKTQRLKTIEENKNYQMSFIAMF